MEKNGFVTLFNAIKGMDESAIKYDKGLGTFDICEIDNQHILHTAAITKPLEPRFYLVNQNMLDRRWDAAYKFYLDGRPEELLETNIHVVRKFQPGQYFIAYSNYTPVVLCPVVRGSEVG